MEKLLVVYVDGWDRRLLDDDRAPFMNEQFDRYPWVRTRAPASVDLLPTILTAARPDQHGMYGVRLRPASRRTLLQRLVDLLPDPVCTGIQCGLFALTGAFDLAAVPPRRRRRFEMLRSKIPRRRRGLEVLLELGGQPTCFGVVGAERCRYIYSTASDPLAEHLEQVGSGDVDLELLQLYTMDLVLRWNYGDAGMVRGYSRRVDRFLRELTERCRTNGVTLMILADHGYDETRGSVDLPALLRTLPVEREEYTEFVEVTSARFWFHSERARREIEAALRPIEHLSVVRPSELTSLGVELDGSDYGELFCLTDPGWVLFPNDFHDVIGNWAQGLLDPKQRRRLTSGRHRGNHALWPGRPASTGFAMLLDDRYRALRDEANLEDIAPSLLAMLGRPKPESMVGTAVFAR